jgi:hypothetical protein
VRLANPIYECRRRSHCGDRGQASAAVAGDLEALLYRDNREIRTFCFDRYALSKQLPEIARTLAARKCGFAKDDNYVTVDVQQDCGKTLCYGVFFSVKTWRNGAGVNGLLLVIQRAYELKPEKEAPGRDSISFARLLELTLQGIRPRPPRR